MINRIDSRSLPFYFLASLFLCSAASVAQSVAPAVRIVSAIDESQLVTLRGNTNPAANAKNDHGPVSALLPMADMVLILSRSADGQAAFDAYVAGEYDQNSPNYHHWLTPSEIGAQYGPAQADIDSITSWLASQGFAIKSISPDRVSIQFSGTAGQAEAAFHTQIRNLLVNGKMHVANMSDPQIPAALAPVIIGIKGLHNFFPHPLHRMGSKVQFNPDAHGWVKLQTSSPASFATGALKAQAPAALSSSASSPKPGFYLSSGYLGVEEDIAPYDFAKIYNLPSGWPNSTSANGSGQIITIIGTSDIDTTDVANFKSAFGLPAGLAPVLAHGPDGDPGICTGSTNACSAGDLDENSLDVEWSGAVAPGAQVVLVTDAYNSQTAPTNDPIYDGAQWAIANASVSGSAVYGSSILSVSYGECELGVGTSGNVAYRNLWETAAAAGIAVFASTGDSGSASCDDGGDAYGDPYEAQYGLSVSGIASTPYNTAVGGTDFSWCQPTLIQTGSSAGNVQGCASTNASTYWNASNSTTTQASAKNYVPETPWNDTCENSLNAAFLESIAKYVGAGTYSTPEESCNFVYEYSLELYFNYGDPALMWYVETVGGSGGASNCVVNDGANTSSCTTTAGSSTTGSSYGNLPIFNDGWPKPSWQSGITGIPADGVRDLPDVSFFSGDGTLDSATLICVSNDGASCTSIAETGTTGTGGAEEVGGTSVATPEMAGVMALINQHAAAKQGSPSAELYDLAGRQTYSECSAESVTNSSNCYFQSIDEGTIAQPCSPVSGKVIEGGAIYVGGGQWESATQYDYYALASPNCSLVDSVDTVGTLSGYSAAAGYNQATGLGSLNVANVVNAWPTGSPSPTFSLSASGVTITQGATTGNTSTIAVAPSDGFTGTVNFTSCTVTTTPSSPTSPVTCGTIAAADVTTSAEAATSLAINSTGTTTAGQYVITITGVSGAITQYATVNVTVTAAPATFALSNGGSISVAPGATTGNTSIITVTPGTGGFSGMVNLTCSISPTASNDPASCSFSSSSVNLSGTTAQTSTLTITTTAASTSGLVRPKPAGKGPGWLGAGSGFVLALLFFFGIPARRRSWRAMLGMALLLAVMGSLSACGGGGGGSGGGGGGNAGTTTGAYTVTVTGTSGTGASQISQTTIVNVTVN